MAIDQEKVERVRNNRINEFSAHLMNNSKWLKLFKALSVIHEKIDNCFIVDIYRITPFRLEIPSIKDFNSTFHQSGIRDVLIGGPMGFKEIRLIEICSQDYLMEIKVLLSNLSQFEVEDIEGGLMVYGYK